MEWSRATELKVGIFVLSAVALGVAVIFVVGAERHLFEDRIHFKSAFNDADGLRSGSPVRVGGMGAGSVESVRFPEDLRSKRIIVSFYVVPDLAERVRQDSVARIASKGLLGDKQLEVSLGTSATKPVRPYGWVKSGRPTGVVDRATAIVERVEETLVEVQRLVKSLADEEMAADVHDVVRGLKSVTDALTDGEGAAHALLYDKQTADNLNRLMSDASATTRELTVASREMGLILRDVRTGNGTAHALLYDREGIESFGHIGRAADELATMLNDVRTQDGFAHSLIYGDDQGNLLANLTEASAGVRQIVADLRAGRGTVGALLVDPSVYEDLKRVIGNVGRSRALRALVRYAITEDEDAPPPPEVRRSER